MAEAQGETLARTLEAVFSKIERERMHDVPILNPALRVACIGMRPFEGGWLCVLITPWFINLVLLPGDTASAEAWDSVPSGTKLVHRFPAGAFEFLCSSEDGIGPYRTCSLFSPVFEFENQDAALAAAEASLTALFDARLDPANEAAAAQTEAASGPVKPQPPKLSRRGLLFGSGK